MAETWPQAVSWAPPTPVTPADAPVTPAHPQPIYVQSAAPPLSPGYEPSPTSGVPAYVLSAPPTAAPLTVYDLPTASSGKVSEGSVVAVASPESKKTWNNRLLPAFCLAASLVVAGALLLATAAPTGVPSAVYSWQTINISSQSPTGIGVMATVTYDLQSKNLSSRPLWENWAGAPAPPLQLWLATMLSTLAAGLVLGFARHPESDESLRRLRFILAFLTFPLCVPLAVAYILVANIAARQVPSWHLQSGGLALDMGSLAFAIIAIVLALRLDRDPMAAELRKEKDRFRLLVDIERQRACEKKEDVRNQRRAAKQIVRDPALAFLMLRKRQAARASL